MIGAISIDPVRGWARTQEAVGVGRRFQLVGLGNLVVVVGVRGSPEQEATQVELEIGRASCRERVSSPV